MEDIEEKYNVILDQIDALEDALSHFTSKEQEVLGERIGEWKTRDETFKALMHLKDLEYADAQRADALSELPHQN